MIVILATIISSPLYAANKLGLGIDFSEGKREYTRESQDLWRDDYEDIDIGVRLYFEHLLNQSLGIQLEFGYYQYDFKDNPNKTYDNWYDFEDYTMKIYDISSLLKYYFYSKRGVSVYIAGGLGLEYKNSEKKEEEVEYFDEVYKRNTKSSSTTLIEQAAIGIQFPLTKRLNVFVEDRFINEISHGQLRVGLYFNLSKERGERR